MTLDRNSSLVKWAYLVSEFGPPSRTSLCVFFWRCVLLTPLAIVAVLALVIVAIGLISAISMLVWTHPRHGVISISGGIAAIVLFLFLRYRIRAWEDRPPSVLWQGAKAITSKFCPLIEIL